MKFIHDGASAHIQIAMQMSHCKDGDVKCLVVQMPFTGYVMMPMLLVGVCHDVNVSLVVCHGANVSLVVCHDANVLFGVCHDANVSLVVCHDANVPLVHAMMHMPLVGMS